MKRLAILLLIAMPMFAADPAPQFGVFEPGSVYREPERNAPPAVSRMFVRAVDAKMAADGVDLPATGGGMIILTMPLSKRGGRVSATLRTPTGDTLRSSERGSAARGLRRFASVDAAEGLGINIPADAQEVIHVERTEAARYHLSDLSGAMLVVAGEPDSALTMTTTAGPLSRAAGQPVTLHATLRDGDAPVTGARVVARLAAPNGVAGDSIALADLGNGEYETVVNDLPSAEAGFCTARYDAEGTTARGVEFARSGSNEIMNERGAARLRARSVHAAIDGDVLHVTAAADVAEAGRYRFDVIVASSRDARGERLGIAWGEAERTLDRGAAQLALDVPLHGAGAKGVFVDVRLLSLDAVGVAGRATVEVGE